MRWNRGNKIGINLTNNGLERLHLDLKDTYTENKKMKLNDFLVKSVRFIRDYSLDHKDDFNNPIDTPVPIWKKSFQFVKS